MIVTAGGAHTLAMMQSVTPTTAPIRRIVLFDGECAMCNWWVQLVIARDPQGLFQFAPRRSPAGEAVLASVRGPMPDPLPDSILLIEGDRLWSKTDASLRISRHLRFPWPLLCALIFIPRPLRDWVYGIIARNRLRWFGKVDQCVVPTPENRSRFLDQIDQPTQSAAALAQH